MSAISAAPAGAPVPAPAPAAGHLVARADVEDFLYREARLLDTGRFEDWYALFTPDALYWVPAGRDDIDPARHLSIIHDDMKALSLRIKRLRSGHAYAQDPASKVHRVVSNVEVREFDEAAQMLQVHSVMLLVELARRRQTIHSARCEFTLQRVEGAWMIVRKKVNLLKNGQVLDNTPFLI
jgi:benzoate/toluate 1,2-dioxygenase beta subunit